jgi:hypothetical protein
MHREIQGNLNLGTVCYLPFKNLPICYQKLQNTKNMQTCGFSCCLWVWYFCLIQKAEQKLQVFEENMVLRKIY